MPTIIDKPTAIPGDECAALRDLATKKKLTADEIDEQLRAIVQACFEAGAEWGKAQQPAQPVARAVARAVAPVQAIAATPPVGDLPMLPALRSFEEIDTDGPETPIDNFVMRHTPGAGEDAFRNSLQAALKYAAKNHTA